MQIHRPELLLMTLITGWPKVKSQISKYNTRDAIKSSIFTAHNIPQEMAYQMADDSNMALSQNTKSNYETVKNNIEICEIVLNVDLCFP